MSAQGLRVLPSRHGAVETLERLEAVIVRQGMTVFTRIDHGAAAEKVGLELRPTVVVVFGNPRAGTPAMQATPTIAIDLPLKRRHDRSTLIERVEALAVQTVGDGVGHRQQAERKALGSMRRLGHQHERSAFRAAALEHFSTNPATPI